MKSNLTIKSNIYYRENLIVDKDKMFLKQVNGREALKKVAIRLTGKMDLLSDFQIDELNNGCGCSKAKKGEITHGQVLKAGEIVCSNRCESSNCISYAKCSSDKNFYKIVRVEKGIEETNILEDRGYILYKSLGINEDLGELGERYKDNVKENVEEVINNKEIKEDEVTYNYTKNEFIKIDDQNKIIKSPIDSRIIVNAGPGTGKTYSVIERILYLLENSMADPENIILLCYTRSARQVVEDRIKDSIDDGRLSSDALDITVCTFDSFATSYLSVVEEELKGLDYNQRIKLFNEKINEDIFEDLEYLIVDEIQDLVNERAMMVLRLLSVIKCGFLLLGDNCQAIYDYDCNEEISINSTEFYKRLFECVGKNVDKYELVSNKRQSSNLADYTNSIRKILLDSECEDKVLNIAEKIDSIEAISNDINKIRELVDLNTKTAILCRTNGEAEYLSSLFNEKKIPHNLFMGGSKRKSYNRVLADIFWDFCNQKIGEEEFLYRYYYRVNSDMEEAKELFLTLQEISGSDKGEIDITNLINGLSNTLDLDEKVLNREYRPLTISTIHRAKGMEYERVYILNNNKINTLDECRVNYVAVTRPRKELAQIKNLSKRKWYFKRDKNGRCIKTGVKPYLKNMTYCTHIVVGLDSDIDEHGFVYVDTEYIDLQEYISTKVNIGDVVEIIREGKDTFYLYHENRKIGVLKENISLEFWESINKTGDKRNIPNRISNIFISNIVTVVNNSFDEKVPLRFRDSKFWLGIEIRGFGKVEYINE